MLTNQRRKGSLSPNWRGMPRKRRKGMFRAKVRVSFMDLRPFQRTFIKNALRPDVDIAALSLPRGNGKSYLAAHLVTRALTPGDAWFVDGKEVVQCAASIEQARIVYNFVRLALEPTGEYRWIDSVTRLGCTHKATNSKLRIISSNGKSAMGLVNTPLAICDEPGSWEVNGGQLMWDALTGAVGKPGSPLKIIVIGTLAPSMAGWWHNLIKDGTHHSTYVMALQGAREKWDSWPEIRRCNPLTAISPTFRAKLLEERDAARADTRLRARFLSYRLNVPSGDESTMLLSPEDLELVEARTPPEREGRPFVGLDIGAGRAWSAAVALYPNGRTEAIALAPGIPDLEEQGRRDRAPAGMYGRLYDIGKLEIAHGLRVQPVAQLWDMVLQAWGKPKLVICDRFKLAELQDVVKGCRLEPRVTRWSEATSDIMALRKMVRDGPMAIDADSFLLIGASLSMTMVKNDDAGSTRLEKNSTNNTGRDDVSAALTLAAGALARNPKRSSGVYLGLVG